MKQRPQSSSVEVFPSPVTRALSIAALTASGLVLVTLASAYHRSEEGSSLYQGNPAVRNAPVESVRCAIYHARFGSRRAQLVRVMKGPVPNYIVMETGKRDPLARSLRSRWLHAAYGDAEPVWLGDFASAEAALSRAAQLCPPELRCWPGEPHCGPEDQPLTPAQVFLKR
jgi:hypothetical protein